ncbi:MAG: bifunctional diaminohydroxyphosphoribosylaminopyrimidine deaminase/5-amino-6-(5-phosphoribosylamino)uracil reductase RibD [Sulfurimonas sp.]|nr:bifunctional diaminohydroxyphosphoribosylaminopyrimidine deaminase/5-amino-6-(5-phosphoribosylamino)uracil reductase RibD [Sulfurimonas sp.]
MVIDSNFFMSLALKEAWKYQGLTYPNPAVGCVITGQKDELLAINAHQKAGSPHAEVMALKDAYIKLTNDKNISEITASKEIHSYLLKNHKNCFKDISIYTTLEPCSHIGKTPSCASLISNLGVKKVFVGVCDINEQASCGNDLLIKNGVEVTTGILKKECEESIYPFNRWNKKNFVFFKWAQRLDGSTDNGIISSNNSRVNVHAMRNLCDLLVIGGNTVRVDRPRLDARLVDGKAPDILIISRKKDFDKTIPLFSVKGRKVIIADNFSLLDEYKNIIIEGSSKMFELSREVVDSYLCYIAPATADKFKILNQSKVEEDIIIWMKREL